MRASNATAHVRHRAADAGNAMVAVVWVTVILMGLMAGMLIRSLGGSKATSADVAESRLLYAAESGLGYCRVQLEADTLYAVKDVQGFTIDPEAKQYVGKKRALDVTATGPREDFRLRLQFLSNAQPVLFADRSNPKEAFDEVKVTCTATLNDRTRTIVAWYASELDPSLRGALVSDMKPLGPSQGAGKGDAKKGHLVFANKGRDGQHYVFGDLLANGDVRYGDAISLDADAAKKLFGGFSGSIQKNLDGTNDQVPDFTNLGGDDQLFDFDRFEAAANAGAGHVYNSLAEFTAAVNAANTAGKKLEGVIVVRVDPASEGGGPKLEDGDSSAPASKDDDGKDDDDKKKKDDDDKKKKDDDDKKKKDDDDKKKKDDDDKKKKDDDDDKKKDDDDDKKKDEDDDKKKDEESGGKKTDKTIYGGINVTGTLVFRFADGTSSDYKVVIQAPLNINAADLSGLDPANEKTYKSGYPAAYADTSKQPWSVDLGSKFDNFQAKDDFPALMFNNGVVDIHGAVNISGAVYGPSFIEIENKKGLTQYFNGAIFGGGGIYVEGNSQAGFTAIRFDENSLNRLVTQNNKGHTIVRSGFTILK